MTDWIIYYKGGGTFSSKGGQPSEAPRDYVQVVMQDNEHFGRDLMDTWDHYCWHDGLWIPHDASGLEQYNADSSISEKVVLNGYWTTDSAFWTIHNAALDNPDWKGLPVRIVRP